MHGGVIEPVTQTANHATDADLTVGSEINFEENVSLNVATARFIGVDRIRFADDLDRSVGVVSRSASRTASRGHRSSIAKSAGFDGAVTATTRAAGSSGNTIAEAGAGDCARDAMTSACSVTFAGGSARE